MSFSSKIILRRPARPNGTCALRLQVVINRKATLLNLKIAWWPELFDEKDGVCLASLPARQRPATYAAVLASAQAAAGLGVEDALQAKADGFNLIIGQALAKANQVLVDHRLSKKPLTIESFLNDYNTDASTDDFVHFFEQKLARRRKRKEITETTYISHNATLNALKEFRPCIPFYSLNTQFVEDFHDFLKKRSKSPNTWWGRHKTLKCYLNYARKARIKFDDPYTDFKNKAVPGKWLPLKPWELEALETYYPNCVEGQAERRVLQKFLFSCYSSLRLSDLKKVELAEFAGKEITFKIQKTYSKKLRDMMLPLTTRAVSYLAHSQRENGTPGFFHYTDQYSNRVLQAIGQRLGIKTHLHHHVGRETYATNFIRAGGAVEVLQKLMDHEKITTTMKYVHVDDDMKRAAVLQFEQAGQAGMAA